MTHFRHATVPAAPAVPPPPPAPAPAADLAAKRADRDSGGITALAVLGAAFVGVLSHGRNPDPLATGIAVGGTFLAGLVVLHVLRFALHLLAKLAKVALPVLAVLLLGCALDWPWAESAVHWLRTLGSHGVEAAERGWVALRAR